MDDNQVLIAPKPFAQFEPDEFREYVLGMFALPTPKRGAKPPSPAPGLFVGRTKKGALSIRRTKVRAFAYVTLDEIKALAESIDCSQADLWNVFKRRKFIVAQSRMDAETIYADLKTIPF